MDRLSTGRETALVGRSSIICYFPLSFALNGSLISFPTVDLWTVDVQPPPHVWFWVWTGGLCGHPARQDIRILQQN